MLKVSYYVVGKPKTDLEGCIGIYLCTVDTSLHEPNGDGQPWVGVIMQGNEDPDWVKESCVDLVKPEDLGEHLMKYVPNMKR